MGETGFGMSAMEDELKQLEGEYSDSTEYSDDEEDEIVENSDAISEDDMINDELYCIACDKCFKTVGARENHETSKKHKDNLNKLVEEMKEEEENVEEVNPVDIEAKEVSNSN